MGDPLVFEEKNRGGVNSERGSREGQTASGREAKF